MTFIGKVPRVNHILGKSHKHMQVGKVQNRREKAIKNDPLGVLLWKSNFY